MSGCRGLFLLTGTPSLPRRQVLIVLIDRCQPEPELEAGAGQIRCKVGMLGSRLPLSILADLRLSHPGAFSHLALREPSLLTGHQQQPGGHFAHGGSQPPTITD